MVLSNKRFNEAFLRAVDFGFDSLGKSCKQALYFHLENSFHVSRESVSERVECFDEALKRDLRGLGPQSGGGTNGG
jgi:hypothetical protein